TKPHEIGARIEFIKSQPTWKGGPLEVMYGLATSRVGEGHAVMEELGPGMSAQEIVDQLGMLREQGVTMSSVPIPPMPSIDAYLDYAQWVIEEIKPKVACGRGLGFEPLRPLHDRRPMRRALTRVAPRRVARGVRSPSSPRMRRSMNAIVFACPMSMPNVSSMRSWREMLVRSRRTKAGGQLSSSIRWLS